MAFAGARQRNACLLMCVTPRSAWQHFNVTSQPIRQSHLDCRRRHPVLLQNIGHPRLAAGSSPFRRWRDGWAAGMDHFAWIALPTVMYGGYSLLQLINRGNALTPFQVNWFRAGHAHAGVLLLMSLLYYVLLDNTSLSPAVKHAACAVLLVGILAQSGGFFVHRDRGRAQSGFDRHDHHHCRSRTARLCNCGAGVWIDHRVLKPPTSGHARLYGNDRLGSQAARGRTSSPRAGPTRTERTGRTPTTFVNAAG